MVGVTGPVDALARLLATGTPKPWVAREEEEGWCIYGLAIPSIPEGAQEYVAGPIHDGDDADLIVALRNTADEWVALRREALRFFAGFDCDPDSTDWEQRQGAVVKVALAALDKKLEAELS